MKSWIKGILASLLLLIGLGFTAETQAQNRADIIGVVLDSARSPLQGATITLMKAADSVLVNYAITDAKGGFNLRRIPKGDYIVQATFIGFNSVTNRVTVTGEQAKINAGKLIMAEEDLNLKTVTIEGERTPILIREDTIEYNADAFNVLPNATVEDLLKRMPGIEVERDGTVKAQGETVQQVLVDGKEFFGTDPKMATKNLPAAVVDKVQVFDQKSDQAQFSGVDDGNEQKTINLELKEDAKAGIFGTIAAGGGTESTYTGRASVNRFDKKLQVSFLGQANNTNQQGFSFNEYSNFMGGIQNMMRGGRGGGGSRASFGGNGVQLGQDISDGFTNTAAGGVNLNYDLKKGTRLNVSYFYNNVRKDLDAQTYQENFLGEVPFISEDSSRDITQNGNHRANLTFRHEFSKRTNIIVRGGLTVNESEFTSVGESFTLSEEGITQNASLQDYISNSESMRGNGSMTLRHRFKKRGRNITLDLNGSTSDGTDVGDLYAENSFFTRGRLETDTVLQDQNQVSDQYNYRAQLNYTEPLGKRRYMTFQLQRSTNFNEVDKEVFDVESGDAIFNNDLSNHYDRFFTTNRVGIEFRKNHRKYNFTIGLDGQTSVLDGRIFYPDSTVGINQDFRAILPDARFDYNFASSKRLSLRYSTNQNEPSIEQLQPIIDNTDPLNIYIGNPDLVPEYTHRLRLRYFSFNQYNYTNFFATINANYTENSITNAKFIDTLFRQITTPQNVDNAFNLTGFLNYGTPFQLGVKLRANINLNSSYSRNIVFVNNTQNSTDTYTNGFDLRLENREKDVVDISIGAKVSTNLTQYSINTELDQSWLNQTYYADILLVLGKTWAVTTSLDYAIYAGDAFNERTDVPIWKAAISKYVLNNNRGELTLAAYDILNQNIGFSRTSQLNYIQEERITSLARYFMLSFTYNLSKFGAEQQQQGPGGKKDRRPQGFQRNSGRNWWRR